MSSQRTCRTSAARWTILVCLPWVTAACSSQTAMNPGPDSGSDLSVGSTTDLNTTDFSKTDLRTTADASVAVDSGGSTFSIKKVFVITMENQGTAAVYGSADASYLNSLMMQGGHATMYGDVLGASVPSEPHYVWMEAGTN